MQFRQHGFTLIELMIVIAILGILASIAIPAYQDYTIKAKVSEAIYSSASAKVAVTDYFSSNGAFPTTRAESGAFLVTTKYVRNLTVLNNGVIAIHVNEDTTGVVNVTSSAMYIRMVPTAPTLSNGVFVWNCEVNSTADGSGTDLVISRLVPPECRN